MMAVRRWEEDGLELELRKEGVWRRVDSIWYLHRLPYVGEYEYWKEKSGEYDSFDRDRPYYEKLWGLE